MKSVTFSLKKIKESQYSLLKTIVYIPFFNNETHFNTILLYILKRCQTLIYDPENNLQESLNMSDVGTTISFSGSFSLIKSTNTLIAV
jgi:hypothetical protein